VPIFVAGLPPETLAERQETLIGYALAVFRVGDMLEAALARLDTTGIDIQLLDATNPDDLSLLYSQIPGVEQAVNADWATTLAVADRSWTLAISSESDLTGLGSWSPWAVLIAGLLATSLLVRYLLAVRGHATRIEERVTERTIQLDEANWELTRVNAALETTARERELQGRSARESQAQTRAIVDAAVDAIITIDERGTVESFNPAAERIFGFAADEVISQNVKMLMPAPYQDEHDGYISDHLRTGESTIIGVGREVVGMRKDGTTFPMDLAVSEVNLTDRRMFTGIVRDISDRKQAESALAQQAEELAQSNAELQDFTYVVSHDLKEPLRGIEAFSTFLEEDHGDKLGDEGKRYVTVVRQNALRMKKLIDDLLELSRIGHLEPNFEPVDVTAVIAEVRDNLSFAVNEKVVDLQVQPELPTVTCNRVRFKEVLHNLVSNAVKFGAEAEAVVKIGYVASNGDHVFSVRDYGIGIDEAYRDKIFQIFQRLNRREDYEGTGAGLTICRKIVEAHGGEIWVDSEPGEGSTFSFTIPQSLKPTKRAEEEEIGQASNAS